MRSIVLGHGTTVGTFFIAGNFMLADVADPFFGFLFARLQQFLRDFVGEEIHLATSWADEDFHWQGVFFG